MKLCVLTPVGPGHLERAKEAEASVRDAWAKSPGPFHELEHHGVFDLDGSRGRGATRNILLQDALQAGADWVFWLDADDLMHPDAFENFRIATEAAPGAAFHWGAIWEQVGDKKPVERPGQAFPANLPELLDADPFLSLQIGYFANADRQAFHPWREDLDAGEDFAMYLAIWKEESCHKGRLPFFINRRGLSSHGPRGATGGQWRREVLAMLELERARLARK